MQSPSGLQYRDFREGSGPAPQEGQTCVVDWSGVTIGYYGEGGTAARRLQCRRCDEGTAAQR